MSDLNLKNLKSARQALSTIVKSRKGRSAVCCPVPGKHQVNNLLRVLKSAAFPGS